MKVWEVAIVGCLGTLASGVLVLGLVAGVMWLYTAIIQ